MRLGARAVAVADSILNVPPGGVDPDAWEDPFRIGLAPDLATADAAMAEGVAEGVMIVERGGDGRLDVVYRTEGAPDGVRSQLIGFAAIAIGILDWTASAARLAARSVPAADLPGRRAQRPDRWRRADRSAGGRQSQLPRRGLRRPAVPDRDHLRDVGGDRGRDREEQPGHGTDDQRRLTTATADGQGRRESARPD